VGNRGCGLPRGPRVIVRNTFVGETLRGQKARARFCIGVGKSKRRGRRNKKTSEHREDRGMREKKKPWVSQEKNCLGTRVG